MSDKHLIKDMCATLGVSRSGYYQWKNAGQSLRVQQTNQLKSLIEKEYAKSRQTYGSIRITRALRDGGKAAGPTPTKPAPIWVTDMTRRRLAVFGRSARPL
jgi:hypothetical protein